MKIFTHALLISLVVAHSIHTGESFIDATARCVNTYTNQVALEYTQDKARVFLTSVTAVPASYDGDNRLQGNLSLVDKILWLDETDTQIFLSDSIPYIGDIKHKKNVILTKIGTWTYDQRTDTPTFTKNSNNAEITNLRITKTATDPNAPEKIVELTSPPTSPRNLCTEADNSKTDIIIAVTANALENAIKFRQNASLILSQKVKQLDEKTFKIDQRIFTPNVIKEDGETIYTYANNGSTFTVSSNGRITKIDWQGEPPFTLPNGVELQTKIQTPVEKCIRHLLLGALLLAEHKIPGGDSDYFIGRTVHSVATSTARKLALLVRTPAYGNFCPEVIRRPGFTQPTPLHTEIKRDVIKKILKNPTVEIGAVALDAIVDRANGELQRHGFYDAIAGSAAGKKCSAIYRALTPQFIQNRAPYLRSVAGNATKFIRMVAIDAVAHKLFGTTAAA